MAITNGYATMAELKARLGLSDDDTTEDAILEGVITAASRMIDADTGREFFKTTEARYFTADEFTLVLIDDLLTLSELKTDDTGDRTYATTWAASDYDLSPLNRSPKVFLEPAPMGRYTFPTIRKGVKITGDWGYCATGAHPDPIREACLIQSARLYKRKDAPFGVMGTPELGVARIPKVDMDVAQLLHSYRKLVMTRA